MLNKSHNAETSGAISTDASRAAVRVIRTDEELMIVRSPCRTLGPGMTSEKWNSDHATK
jgi:acetate kinase